MAPKKRMHQNGRLPSYLLVTRHTQAERSINLMGLGYTPNFLAIFLNYLPQALQLVT